MKRLTIAIAVAAFTAAVLVAWSAAATLDGAGPATVQKATKKAKLPPLPAEVRRNKRWRIGVKCDAPPFGYVNVRGEHAGFDIEIAHWFARYAFGKSNRVSFICAPTPTREPLLTTDRADLVIATFTYTRDRDTRIDYSRAYYKATGRLLVRNDSPIHSLSDLRDKTVSTTSGSIYDRWVKRCFQDTMNTKLIVTDNLTNALLAFSQGRADTVMWDDTVLAVQAGLDPNTKLTPDLFLALPYGIGIKQGNVAMKRWVDARLELMRKADIFMSILRNSIPRRFVAGFTPNILRPKNTFGYAPATAPAPDTVCP
jgi:polar amino acid transport system substrate-binding protein